MSSLVGQQVFEDDHYVGIVEREFVCTWGRRKGLIQSIQVSGMDVTWKRSHIPGILYWSGTWKNKLNPFANYSVGTSRKRVRFE